MGTVVALIIGAIIGYLVGALGYKSVIADLEAEIARLKARF